MLPARDQHPHRARGGRGKQAAARRRSSASSAARSAPSVDLDAARRAHHHPRLRRARRPTAARARAAITGGLVALALAARGAPWPEAALAPAAMVPVAAVSVGHRRRRGACSTSPTRRTRAADVDMNVVMTGEGKLVEVQGTAEKAPFARRELDALMRRRRPAGVSAADRGAEARARRDDGRSRRHPATAGKLASCARCSAASEVLSLDDVAAHARGRGGRRRRSRATRARRRGRGPRRPGCRSAGRRQRPRGRRPRRRARRALGAVCPGERCGPHPGAPPGDGAGVGRGAGGVLPRRARARLTRGRGAARRGRVPRLDSPRAPRDGRLRLRPGVPRPGARAHDGRALAEGEGTRLAPRTGAGSAGAVPPRPVSPKTELRLLRRAIGSGDRRTLLAEEVAMPLDLEKLGELLVAVFIGSSTLLLTAAIAWRVALKPTMRAPSSTGRPAREPIPWSPAGDGAGGGGPWPEGQARRPAGRQSERLPGADVRRRGRREEEEALTGEVGESRRSGRLGRLAGRPTRSSGDVRDPGREGNRRGRRGCPRAETEAGVDAGLGRSGSSRGTGECQSGAIRCRRTR